MRYMKLFKNLMLLAAGTLAMASCLRQNTWNPYTDGDELNGNEPVPVQLRTNRPVSSVDVKAQGALDNWDGNQEVFIYGIAREGENAAATLDKPLDFTYGILIGNEKAFKNPEAVAQPGDTQPIELYFNEQSEPKELFYYDEDRRYEFFGYYVDDAATSVDAATGKPTPTVGEGAITLPVSINGSQDLMLAYAHKDDDNKGIGINVNRMYSAYSARKGIHPSLQFDHQLARFDVRVMSGDFKVGQPELAAKLTLAKVTVESHYNGTLHIANKDHNSNPPYLDVDASTSKPLDIWLPLDGELKPLSADHKFKLAWENEDGTIVAPDQFSDIRTYAGTVMVMPGQQKYTLYIGMLQDEYSSGLVEYTSEIDFTHVVAAEGLEPDTQAVGGHQYEIDVFVYGLQGVDVRVSMTEWQAAGNFILDRDREVEIIIPDDKLELNFYSENDDPITIGATTFPNAAQSGMIYRSLNEAVATVDASGTVTPKGRGTTYIYVKAPAYGDYAESTRIVTVVVLPNAEFDVASSVEVHRGAGQGKVDPYHLNVEQDKQNAPITFTIDDESIATIDSHGNITALAVGTTTIHVTAGAVKDVCREFTKDVTLNVVE